MSAQHPDQIPAAAIVAELRSLRETIAQLCSINGARLSREQVCERLGVHRSTIKRYIDTGIFPAPGRDGRWALADIIRWEGQRMGDRP